MSACEPIPVAKPAICLPPIQIILETCLLLTFTLPNLHQRMQAQDVELNRGQQKSADLVPHDGLQIMRETGDRQDVRKLGGQARIGVRFGLVVLLRFVSRLYAEESGVIGALTMDKRNETLIRELLLATVGDGD